MSQPKNKKLKPNEDKNQPSIAQLFSKKSNEFGADTKRTISADHRLKSKLRTNINLETENKYMFIHYNMPDLAEWGPIYAANLFVSEKVRRERDITTAVGNKCREQPYFKGVFPEAKDLVDPDLVDDDDDNDEMSTTVFEF